MAKKGWTQREGKRFVFEVGLVCNIGALITIFLSFVSPYWIISWPRVYSPFRKIGLWEVCLEGMILEIDPTQKSYHGCWWILAPEFWRITRWLMPPWFVWTQVAVTFCLVAEMLVVGLLIFIYIRTGMTQRDEKTKRRKDPFVLINISAITTFVYGCVMGATVIMFGIMFKYDKNWFPNPELNYMSWSYGLAIVSTFFSVGASIGLFTYVGIIRQEMREPPIADPMAPVSALNWDESYKGQHQVKGASRDNLNKSKENMNRSKENTSMSKENLSLLVDEAGGESEA